MDKATFIYKVAGACSIHADVYRAETDAPAPVIVWIHGGALIFGHRSNLSPLQCKLYTDAGYTVVSIDYRLAPETKLPEIVEDLRDALAWVRGRGPELFNADPSRLAVVGHSAGGFLTLTSGYAVEPQPRALVSFYGYGDIAGAWYSQPSPHYCTMPRVTEEDARSSVGTATTSEGQGGERFRFYLYCRQGGLWPREVVGGDAATVARFCPIQHVTPAYPPTLLFHGSEDTDVPVEESVAMAEALRRQGVAVDLQVLPGLGHGFDRGQPDGRNPAVSAVFERVLSFLARHLV